MLLIILVVFIVSLTRIQDWVARLIIFGLLIGNVFFLCVLAQILFRVRIVLDSQSKTVTLFHMSYPKHFLMF